MTKIAYICTKADSTHSLRTHSDASIQACHSAVFKFANGPHEGKEFSFSVAELASSLSKTWKTRSFPVKPLQPARNSGPDFPDKVKLSRTEASWLASTAYGIYHQKYKYV